MDTNKPDIQLAQLTDSRSPQAAFEEVKNNFIYHYPVKEFLGVRNAFNDFIDLFDGKYPGYRSCNTKFHDKVHTTDALLAISRLIDGYNLLHSKLPVNKVKIALISAIFHDTGYIQTKQETNGTGARFTLHHVKRSIIFIKKYFKKKGLPKSDFCLASNMVSCTGLETNIANIKFQQSSDKLLSLMLGTSDLIGQMSSRNYLEKLLFLYREFKNGDVAGYESEFDLLRKTTGFYAFSKKRLSTELQNMDRFAQTHFFKRYKINKNLYRVAIERQINYLKNIIEQPSVNYCQKLRRQ